MHILAGYAQRRGSATGQRVLVFGPDAASVAEVEAILGAAGYQTDCCHTVEAALDVLARGKHGALVTSGLEGPREAIAFARRVLSSLTELSVILVVSDLVPDVAIGALQTGVFDYVTKSFGAALLGEQLVDALRRSLSIDPITASSAPPSASRPLRDPVREVLVGQCSLIELAREAVRAALDDDAPVLIIGEAGTEKHPLARLLHDASGRRGRPFAVANTSHGALEMGSAGDEAPPGTLFISDASSLDQKWQMQLVKRLSALGTSSDGAATRIVAGVNQPPANGWEGGVLLRLFHSVGAKHVTLPPLRQRGRDVVILAEHFAEQVRLARGDALLRITRTAIEALSGYAWPGNVDELRFAIQHAASLCQASMIRVADLPPSIGLCLNGTSGENGSRLQVQSLEDMELAYILRVLEAVGGNKASAARLLGVDRTTLYRKLQRQEQASSARSEPPPDRARK
jgi:two-component system, NtrC family, response regulator HydG